MLHFVEVTFSQLLRFYDSCFFKAATFKQREPLFYMKLFQNIYFFTPSLVFTAIFSIYQLLSNVNVEAFKP